MCLQAFNRFATGPWAGVAFSSIQPVFKYLKFINSGY